MNKKTLSIGALVFLMPTLTFAQNFTYLNNWFTQAESWLSRLITAVMVLMTLYFMISVFRYIAEKDATKLKERRASVVNGLIGLFIAVSVWGIIRIAGSVVGTQGNSAGVGLVCPPGMSAYQSSTGGSFCK